MTREQAVEKLTADIVALAGRHPPGGALAHHVKQSLELAGLGRQRVWANLVQATSLLKAVRGKAKPEDILPHFVGAALMIGAASIGGKGNLAYKILFRYLQKATTDLQKELNGRAPRKTAKASRSERAREVAG